MGIKAIDITPLSGPSTNVPAAKDIQTKVFSVARTETTAAVKAWLPGDATILDIRLIGALSDAGDSASVSVGSTSTSTEYLNAQDVKTAGGMIRPTTAFSATNLPNLQPTPVTGDLPIYAKYTEAGTASTAGGPYYVVIEYVR